MLVVSNVLLSACIVLSYSFVVLYAALAPWHRYPTGRHIMGTTIALALVFTYIALARLGILGDLSPTGRHAVSAAVYGIMAVILTWRITILIRVQLRTRRRKVSTKGADNATAR